MSIWHDLVNPLVNKGHLAHSMWSSAKCENILNRLTPASLWPPPTDSPPTVILLPPFQEDPPWSYWAHLGDPGNSF